jgi:hypothetical protein
VYSNAMTPNIKGSGLSLPYGKERPDPIRITRLPASRRGED